MKNTRTCSKCQSTTIARIEGKVGAYGSGNNIMLGWSLWSAMKVTRFVCCDCGYSEEWIESPADLKTIRDQLQEGKLV